jgi:hypothetical protein
MVSAINTAQTTPSVTAYSACDQGLASIKSVYQLAVNFFNDIKKFLYYSVSLFCKKIQHSLFPNSYQWYNQICPEITVGAIPLKERNMLPFLDNKSVLAIVEPFELEPSWAACPLTPSDYQSQNTVFKHVIAEDFKALTQNQIKEAIAFIEDQVKADRETYVHCKAGRGRSATAVICYLLKNKFPGCASVDNSIAFVKAQRLQTKINPRQKEAIEIYFNSLS